MLDIDEAADCAGNFLKALRKEMDIAIRCLGKTSVHELSKEDLVSMTRDMAEITGVRPAYPVHTIE